MTISSTPQAFRLGPGNLALLTTNTHSLHDVVGTLAYDPARRLLWIPGHAQQTRIAAFPVPDRSVRGSTVNGSSDLLMSEPPVQHITLNVRYYSLHVPTEAQQERP